MTQAEMTAKQMGLVSCRSCHLLCRVPQADNRSNSHCPRCGSILHSRKRNSLSRCWALVLAASILLLPANLLPITITAALGRTQTDTIISGVIYFLQTGVWPIALVIFVASVFVPLAKLSILMALLLSVQLRWRWRPRERTQLYRLTELIGRWSMVDVYVVTILVALVSLGNLATIEAGIGAVFFGGVVIVTMVAAETFDPRLIWDRLEASHA